MNTFETRVNAAKAVAKIVVGRSVSGVVVTLIHQNTNTEEFTKAQKAGVYVGAYCVGDAVAARCEERVNEKIDAIAKWIVEFKELNKKTETPDPS